MRFHQLEEAISSGAVFALDDSDRDRFLVHLRNGQKFYLGDGVDLPDPNRDADVPRAPYPWCCFEMMLPTEEGPFVPCVVLTYEEYGKGILAFPIFRSSDTKTWAATGVIKIDRSDLGHFHYRMPKHVAQKLSEAGAAQLKKMASVAFWTLWRGLAVLNCVNVKTQTVDASVALNKKRERSGKPPVYSYKTLVLRPSPAQRADDGGTHESPRIHLRRGHIKHRKTGDFWWQPHVVGDRTRGMVMKDYRADQLISSRDSEETSAPSVAGS